MPEHLMYYHHAMWAVLCQLALDPEEELYIHYSFHFSDQPLLISGLPLNNLELLPLASVLCYHQSMITIWIEGTNE